MTRIQRLILLLCILPITVFAQDPPYPIYQIKKDSLPATELAAFFLQAMPDAAGKLTIGQAAQAKFQTAKSTAVRFDKSTVYWLRYRFENTLNRPVTVWLQTHTSRSDFYVQDSTGKWTHKVSGIDVPWSARSDQRELLLVHFTIGPGNTLPVYQRTTFAAKDDAPQLKVTFRVSDDIRPLLEDYYDQQFFKHSYYSALSGVLLLAAIITLLFYSVSREKVFLWFTLFGLSFSLLQF